MAARADASRRVTVRRAEPSDLATVVSLRLALLREYGDHPLYAELHHDVVDRAFDLYHAQIAAADERLFLADVRRRSGRDSPRRRRPRIAARAARAVLLRLLRLRGAVGPAPRCDARARARRRGLV